MSEAGDPAPTGHTNRNVSYWRACLVLLGAGMLGVLSLYPTLGPTASALLQRPEAPAVSRPLLQLLLLINPILLLVVGVVVGTALAPRLGLRSHLAEAASGRTGAGPRLRQILPRAVGWGAAAGALTLLLDPIFRPLLGETAAALAALEAAQPRTLTVTLSGLLYGGITEELMVRWGLLSLIAWLLWRLAGRAKGGPRPWALWTATVVAALLFGAGHLGAVAAQLELTPMLVVRTVALNAVAGTIFGWLFWRWSLEAAMVAHATAHVVLTVVSWVGLLFGA